MSTEVIEIVNKWLKNPSESLDISSLGLKEWSECLKDKEHLIKTLRCNNNRLESIPVLLKLTELECSHNRLKTIPVFPNLTNLWCNSNRLESIPVLPKLVKLWCENNPLKSIPVLPNLTILFCDDNQLESIPILPNLTHLWCKITGLRYSQSFPNLLICGVVITDLKVYQFFPILLVWCENNPLKSIPVLPNLTKLECYDNLLFSNDLDSWEKIWKIQNLRKSELRKSGIQKFLKL